MIGLKTLRTLAFLGLALALATAAFADNLPGAKGPSGAVPEAVYIQCPPDVDGVDTDGDGNVSNDNLCMHFTSGDGFIKMADGTDMFILGFGDVTGIPPEQVMSAGSLAAEFSAPTLVLREGQRAYLTLTNVTMIMRPDLFDPHSIHFHGFPNASTILDGEPMASLGVNMGSSLTYYYNLAEPGTYLYHCHVEAAEHMQMGMLGNLYVLAAQDNLPAGFTFANAFVHQAGYKYAYNDEDGSTRYDVDFPVQISSFDPNFHNASLNVQPLDFAGMRDTYPMINGRGYPDTVNPAVINNQNGFPAQKVHSRFEATAGQKILLRVSSVSTVDFYSLTVAGLPMKVVGVGARLLRGPDPDGPGPLLGKNLYYDTSTINLGGGQTADVILDTAGAAPGTYCLYTTNLAHLSNNVQDFGGMMTEIVINPVR